MKAASVLLLLAGAAVAVPAPGGPQQTTGTTPEVDAFIRREMAEKRIPGLALAVLREGETIKLQGYGWADLEHRVPITPETLFQSASVGKQFTAAALLLLADRGKLDLDDPVKKHLPEVPDSWSDVRVRHLLNHTSGIRNYTAEQLDLRRDYSEEELLELASSMPRDFEAGRYWSYSNTGYVLAGILIGRLTGQFYGEFLRREIFQPLGMESAQVNDQRRLIPHRAAGYVLREGEWIHQDFVSPSLNSTADGSLLFSALDLVAWVRALRKRSLLSEAAYQAWWSPTRLRDGRSANYGLGWVLGRSGEVRWVEHSGGWQGFSTHLLFGIDHPWSVALLVNRSGVRTSSLAHRILALYEPKLAPTIPSPALLRPEALAEFAGTYELPAHRRIRVRVEGNSLRVGSGDDPESYLPAGEDLFFLAEDPLVQLRFLRDPAGRIRALALLSGTVQEAWRLP